jgi:uncharacterized protein (TIGR02302 family)
MTAPRIPEPDRAGEKFLRAVAWRRTAAQGAILWERVWPGLWPPIALLGLLLIAALLDLPKLLPAWLHVCLLGVGGVALLLLLWRAFAFVVLPLATEGDRRIEQASGLKHRPLDLLADRLAAGQGDPETERLWRAHLSRTLARVGRLSIGWPAPGMAARDPRALRYALVLSVLAAFVVAGGNAPGRLARALEPQLAAPKPSLPVKLDVWISPPAYTGIAPIFLDAAGSRGEVAVPVGSRLTAALSGGTGAPELRVGELATPFQALDENAWSVETVLQAGERLAVLRDGREIAAWPLSVVPDAPPLVAHASPPARARDSRAVRLEYEASDDFGLAEIKAELRLEARPAEAPIAIDLPLPGALPRRAKGGGGGDLTAHPWAGLPVLVRLVARDGAGQEGFSEDARLILPERPFTHPVAKLLVAVRRGLSLDPADRNSAMRELDRISREPAAFDDDTTVFLGIRTARARLFRDRRPDAIAEVQEILWELAIRLEEGSADRTERAVSALREEIKRLLDQARRGEEIDKAELDRLLRELSEAVQRHLEALAEKAEREGRVERMDPDQQDRAIDQRDIARMMERMREAARQDRMNDAQRQLEQLERMLESLREGRMARPENPERQQRRQQGQNAQSAVADMIQRQGALMDRGNQREQERLADQQQRRPNPRDLQSQQQAREREANRQREAEAGRTQDQRQQQALRRALGEIMQQFGDATGEVPEPLGRADQEMRAANEALRSGREAEAQASQQRAIDALQEGGRQMQQQMARQFGRGQQQRGQQGDQPGEGEGEGEGEGDSNGFEGGDSEGQGRERAQGRDPLGRPRADETGGADEGSDVRVPDEIEQQRTRAIQQELRRRQGERERPQQELDYIERLLRRF